MDFAFRFAFALAVLVPAIVTFGVRGAGPIAALAFAAFLGGRLLGLLLARRPAIRAVATALCLLVAVAAAVWALAEVSRPRVDAYRNVDEVGPALAGDTLRVRGYVVPGSMAPRHYLLSFGQKRLRVVDAGSLRPDNLRDGMEVMAHGVLKDDGVFYADSAITRCPDNYDRSKGERPF
ncbi:MAG TPA: cytochrome c maturation protein CcmE [Haliangiales bacterium]|nr:cytochrome c maturation protein CcmE [Haliangiales bacterium]